MQIYGSSIIEAKKWIKIKSSWNKKNFRNGGNDCIKKSKIIKAISKESEQLSTKFSLSDNLYATADIECNGTVCLWLGVLRTNYTK